jgi:hypothetical protein
MKRKFPRWRRLARMPSNKAETPPVIASRKPHLSPCTHTEFKQNLPVEMLPSAFTSRNDRRKQPRSRDRRRKISEERKEDSPQIFCGVVNCFAAAGVGLCKCWTPLQADFPTDREHLFDLPAAFLLQLPFQLNFNRVGSIQLEPLPFALPLTKIAFYPNTNTEYQD